MQSDNEMRVASLTQPFPDTLLSNDKLNKEQKKIWLGNIIKRRVMTAAAICKSVTRWPKTSPAAQNHIIRFTG